MHYRWTILEPPDPVRLKGLAAEIQTTETIARVLMNRGIETFECARDFFRPDISMLHDPFLMDSMHAAVDRVLRALEQREKILVFGDYDVDGTNGAAMLMLFLRDIGADVIVHIPNRAQEGYGVSKVGIDRAYREHATLIVAVDCGITAVDQVEYARSLGIEVVICDHHEPGERLPAACAVLDPVKPGCAYPFRYLSGCGVGFKLAQGIAKTLGRPELPNKYLDFVALATTADIVPLVGENRALVKLGLDLINTDPRPGIRALLETAGVQLGSVQTEQVAFVIAPRINAAGRLGDAARAVDLLVSTDPVAARRCAEELEQENRNRRRIDKETFLSAQALVEEFLDFEKDSAIVLHQEQWHPGVIGIVAARLVEKYYRPTIMMTTVKGVAKGSARSIAGFDIYQALRKVEDKMIEFGGHKYAAGLSVELARLDEFKEAFNQAVKELLPEELLTPELRVDAEVSLGELTPKFVRIIDRFGPFGSQNTRPAFAARSVELVGEPRIVGKNHLKLKLRQNGRVFDAIGFKLGGLLGEIDRSKRTLDIVFSIEAADNGCYARPPLGVQGMQFQPEEHLQLRIKDLR